MRKVSTFILVFIFATGLFSCTISKRQHQPGFYFSWNHYASPIKEITSTPSVPVRSDENSIVALASIDEKDNIEKKDTIPPQPSTEIRTSTEIQNKPELPKSEMMKIEASHIQVIHRIKQLVTAGGLFGVVFGSFYFATAYTVTYPFLSVLLLIALFAVITGLIGLIITIKVKKFKNKYPEFSDTPEYKKALKARKRARFSLYFSYGLFMLDLILAIFAVLIDFLTVY